MVLNIKNLKQNSDKRYEQNFDWGINVLKGYRREIEDDNSKLLTFLKDNIDIDRVRTQFESDKDEFLDEYYYGNGSKADYSERLEEFLKVVEKDLKSFYIFSKVVVTTPYENLLNELVIKLKQNQGLEIGNIDISFGLYMEKSQILGGKRG